MEASVYTGKAAFMHQHNAPSMKKLFHTKMRMLMLSVLFSFGLYSPFHAATLWVTTVADAGSGSLRQALLDATAGDSIRFDASLDGTPIVLSSALPALQPVVVKGNGMAKTIVTSNANDRLFVVPFIASGLIALEDLSLLNAAPSGVTAVGGAIFCNGGSLTLRRVKLDGNTSPASGGALYFESNGTLRMEGCIVSNNHAVEGGGVYVSSGTFPLSYSPKVEIENCSFHHNTATGTSTITAADLAHLGDELMVRNSTFAEGDAVNAVYVEGGSFGLARSFESTTITASTGVGLGTCQPLTLTNCLLAGNTGADLDNACLSSITGSNNLIHTAISFSAGSIGLTGVDAKLEPLTDAGNGAMVAYPALCSPAVDAGAAGLGNDQLDMAPVGVRDIGAVEQLRLVPNVRASNAVGGSVNISWDSPAETALCPSLPAGLGIEILRDGTFIGLPASPTATSFVDPFPQEGFQTYSAVTTLAGIRGGAIEVLGRQAPNRSITGFVTNNAGSPVQNVQVCAFDSTQQGALMTDPDGNGVGGYLSQPLDMGPDGTIAVWLHRNDWSSTPSGATFSGIVGSSEAFRMLLDHATKDLYVFYGPLFGSGTNFSIPSDTFSPGWHHLGLTWDSEGGSVAFTLYLDGDTAYHQSGSPAFIEPESVWTLGGANNLIGIPFSPWPGMMDELQIYDAAKGAEFFRRFRRNIPEPSAPNLKLYYPFDPIAAADGLLWPNHAQSAETQMAEQIGFLTNGAGMGVDAGHCALTDATGNYAISPIDLQGLNYTVRPVEENRFYDPALQLANNSSNTGKNFKDTTSYVVQGQVALGGTSCDLDSVKIVVTGPVALPVNFTYTATDGSWNFAVPVEGNWTFTPTPDGAYVSHAFVPEARTFLVAEDLLNVNFSDTSTSRLQGSFLGTCIVGFGPDTTPLYNVFTDSVQFTVRTQDLCFNESYTTDGTNRWDIRVPAIDAEVVLSQAFNPTPSGGDFLSSGFIDARIDALDIRNLALPLGTARDTSAHFQFRQAPELVVDDFGMPRPIDPGCTGSISDTIISLVQLGTYPVGIRMEERFPYAGFTTSCPVRTGYQLNYQDNASGKTSGIFLPDSLLSLDSTILLANADSVLIQVGQNEAVYLLQARNVNIATGGPLDYGQFVQFEAQAPGEALESDGRFVVVEGVQSSELNSFARTPALPTAVLRDPPGANSYSSTASIEQSCFEYNLSNKKTESDALFGEVTLGNSVSLGTEIAGFSVSSNFSFFASVGGGHEWGSSNITKTTRRGCTQWTSETRTSDDPAFVGPDADIFIGAAYLYRYGVVDEVAYDTVCNSFETVRTLVLAEDSTEATFQLTRFQIREEQIPALQAAFNLIPKVPDTLETGLIVLVPSDSALRILNQIDVWQQTLRLTDSLSEQALLGDASTELLSGGVTTSRSRSNTNSGSTSIGFDMEYDSDIVVEAGFDAAGSGARFGYRHQWNIQDDSLGTTSADTTKVTGFTFSDPDPGDLYDITYAWDPVYGTPAFRLNAGQTSCPNEPGTVPRDTVLLSIDASNKYVPAPANAVDFTIQLSNIAQTLTDTERNICLAVTDNFENLTVTASGGDLVVPRCFDVDSLTTETIVMTATNNTASINRFQDLRLLAMASCMVDAYEDFGASAIQVLAEQRFSVEYESTCPDVVLVEPLSDWLVNLAGNTLRFSFDNIGVDQVVRMTPQYRIAPFGLWQDLAPIDSAELSLYTPGAPVNYLWNPDAGIVDGPYDVRAKIECNSGDITYTGIVSGNMAREASQVAATFPSDGGTLTGGLVSIAFSEDLFCGLVDAGTVEVSFAETGVFLGLADIICNGNTLSFVNDFALTPLCAVENEWIHYRVYGMTDVFGNVIDTFEWTIYLDIFEDPVASLTTTQPSAGGSDGSIQLDLNGLYPPYTSLWTNASGDTLFNGSIAGSTQSITGLPAGTYTVLVEDNKCSQVLDSVVLGSTAVCSSSIPPQAPGHQIMGNKVRLRWDAVPQSVACQIRGNRLSPSPISGKRSINAFEADQTDIPFRALGAGSIWTYQVRCACSLSPIDITAYSALDTFAVPSAREQMTEPEVRLYPNPTAQMALVDLHGFAGQEVHIHVFGLDGRTVHTQFKQVALEHETLQLNAAHWPNGLYRVQLGTKGWTKSYPLYKQD